MGGRGVDLLRGGAGADRLRGEAGGDVFDLDPGDTGVGAGRRDLMLDFAQDADRIDLASIDARGGVAGDQAFAFLGTGALTGAGQLRFAFVGLGTLIQGSTDADAAPELELQLAGRSRSGPATSCSEPGGEAAGRRAARGRVRWPPLSAAPGAALPGHADPASTLSSIMLIMRQQGFLQKGGTFNVLG